MDIEIKYNKPIEVTKSQYARIMNECSGIAAGREDNGKFFIKVWLMQYANNVRAILINE